MTSLTGETGCSLKRYFERHCFRVRERSAHSCHRFGKFQCSRALFVEGHLVGATTGLSAPARVPCLLHCAARAAAGSKRLRLRTICKCAIDDEGLIKATDLTGECNRTALAGNRVLLSACACIERQGCAAPS